MNKDKFIQGLVESGVFAIMHKRTGKIIAIMEIFEYGVIPYGFSHENYVNFDDLHNHYTYINGCEIEC